MKITLECSKTLCTTCGQPIDNPYRRWNDGKIAEGCVSEEHTLSAWLLSPISRSWHESEAAVKIRAETKKRLES